MRGVLVVLSLTCLAAAHAQQATETPERRIIDNAWVAVGPVSVTPDETVQSVVAIGPISIAGTVMGDVTSVGGRVSVAATGVVHGQVVALCALVEVAEGGKVIGGVRSGELELVASTPLTPRLPPEAELVIGDREFAEPNLRQAIVLGGNALVREGAGLTEIIVIGGDLRIEAGTQVRATRVIGGQLERVAGFAEAQDERAEPFLLRLTGRTAAERYAVARLTSSFESDEGNVKLAAMSETWNTGEIHLAAFAPESRVELTVAAKQVLRSPLPPGRSLEQYIDGATDTGWDSWPKRYPFIPSDADPLLQKSSALGVGLRIDATIERPDDPQRRVSQRTVTLGVPADAVGLVLEREGR